MVNGIEIVEVCAGPHGVCEGQEPADMEIDVMVSGGDDGQLPETVLTIVLGVQGGDAGPTGVVEQEVSTEMLVMVVAESVIVFVPQDVIGEQVLIGPTGEVGEQVSMVEMLVMGTQDGQDSPVVTVTGGSVTGGRVEQLPVPTGPTGEVEGQLSVIVTAEHVSLPQADELPLP